MELIISQIRWPAEVYKRVKERAYRERKSINKTVVELVVSAMEVKEVKQWISH